MENNETGVKNIETENKENVVVQEPLVDNEVKEPITMVNEVPVAKSSNKTVIILLIILIISVLTVGGIFYYQLAIKDDKKQSNNDNSLIDDNKKEPEIQQTPKSEYLSSRITGNKIEDFDISFLKIENARKNIIYSPLALKYSLAMLNEGTSGNSNEQIKDVIGDYTPKKYNNSKNLSLANAFFVKDTIKDTIKDSYKNTLQSKYNAEIIIDNFKNTTNINAWIKNKTFNNIENLLEDINDRTFILINTLSLDMDWINKIKSEHDQYYKYYLHREFEKHILPLDLSDYDLIDFEGLSNKVKSTEIGAVINKYDIVNVLGEDNIRATVGKEYEKWLAEETNEFIKKEFPSDVNTYLDKYMNEISKGYKDISSSTDFEFFVDDDIKVFAKDLKTYDGTTLQYVGIMPIEDSLNNYVSNISSTKLNDIIGSLKKIELNSFKEGYITEITGYIPMFKFDYKLDLIKDLQKLNITDIFQLDKADLSKLTSTKMYVSDALHKSNIEFSNDGIKASAVVEVSGAGADRMGFDYIYDVPIEHIDLTFDKPYLFLIRDKSSNELFFVGTVYNPTDDYVPSLIH